MNEQSNTSSLQIGRRSLLSAMAVATVALADVSFGNFAQAADGNTAAGNVKKTKPLVVKNVAIGEGRPKTIVPITANNAADVRATAEKLGKQPEIDLIEFRVDYLDIALDAEAVAALSKDVSALVNNKPVILTFRTKKEGGVTAIEDSAYADFYSTILKKGAADFVDVELVRDEAAVRRIVKDAHQAGAYVVMSNHDFHNTAPSKELVRRLKLMESLGADILKLAAMPHDAGDVLSLLAATWEMRSQHTERPMITMSMGGTGVVSRLTGELFGSAATFGMVGTASAPGQIDVNALVTVLDTIHKSIAGA